MSMNECGAVISWATIQETRIEMPPLAQPPSLALLLETFSATLKDLL
jgi:hypothetical protein